MNIGIVAGYGNIVNIIWKEIKKEGFDPLVIDIVGRKYPSNVKKVELEPINIATFLNILNNYHIDTLALVGRVDKKKILNSLNSYLEAKYARTERGDLNLLIELEKLLNSSNIRILDLKNYVKPYIAKNRIYTNIKIYDKEWDSIFFGAKRAKLLSDLEIGQTIVVKEMIVYAVEAIEGTDNCIKRAALLGGEEGIIVKVGRTKQQFSLEIPTIGLDTVKNAIDSNMKILAIEAGKTLFIDQKESVDLANKHNLKIVGFSLETKR